MADQKALAASLRWEVANLAERTTFLVMQDAESTGQHSPGSWTNEGLEHHLTHVVNHISAYMAGDRSEPHLEHMVCRAVMALWSENHDKLGDNGPEGAKLQEPDRCINCSAIYSRGDRHQAWCPESEEYKETTRVVAELEGEKKI